MISSRNARASAASAGFAGGGVPAGVDEDVAAGSESSESRNWSASCSLDPGLDMVHSRLGLSLTPINFARVLPPPTRGVPRLATYGLK